MQIEACAIPPAIAIYAKHVNCKINLKYRIHASVITLNYFKNLHHLIRWRALWRLPGPNRDLLNLLAYFLIIFMRLYLAVAILTF